MATSTILLSRRMTIDLMHYWKNFALIQENHKFVTLCLLAADLPAICYLGSKLTLAGEGCEVKKSLRKHGEIVTWKAKYFPRVGSIGLTFTWSYDNCKTLVFSCDEWRQLLLHLPDIQRYIVTPKPLDCPPDLVYNAKPGELQLFHFCLKDGHNDEVIAQPTYPSHTYDECMTRASQMALRFQYNTFIYPPLEIYVNSTVQPSPSRGELLKCSATYLVRHIVKRMREKCDDLGFGFFTDAEIVGLSDPQLKSAFLAGMATFVQAELKVPTDPWVLIAAETLLQSITPSNFLEITHCDTYDVFFAEYLDIKNEFEM